MPLNSAILVLDDVCKGIDENRFFLVKFLVQFNMMSDLKDLSVLRPSRLSKHYMMFNYWVFDGFLSRTTADAATLQRVSLPIKHRQAVRCPHPFGT